MPLSSACSVMSCLHGQNTVDLIDRLVGPQDLPVGMQERNFPTVHRLSRLQTVYSYAGRRDGRRQKVGRGEASKAAVQAQKSALMSRDF